MSEAPAAGWIAPDFPPGWYMSGPFREHPAGLLAPAAALARLGYPAPQAAYALNALYQVLTIVLAPAPRGDARAGPRVARPGVARAAAADRLHVPHPREPRAGAPALPRGRALRHRALAEPSPLRAPDGGGARGPAAGEGRPGRVRAGPVRPVASLPPPHGLPAGALGPRGLARPRGGRRGDGRDGGASTSTSTGSRRGSPSGPSTSPGSSAWPRRRATGPAFCAKAGNLAWYLGRVALVPVSLEPLAAPGRLARSPAPGPARRLRELAVGEGCPGRGPVRGRDRRPVRGPLQPLGPTRRPLHLPRVLRGRRRGRSGRLARVDPPARPRRERWTGPGCRPRSGPSPLPPTSSRAGSACPRSRSGAPSRARLPAGSPRTCPARPRC